jgi:NAD-dependent SIR2 family protein deacetylase
MQEASNKGEPYKMKCSRCQGPIPKGEQPGWRNKKPYCHRCFNYENNWGEYNGRRWAFVKQLGGIRSR